MTVTEIIKETVTVAEQLFEAAKLAAGDIVIVGCSSSEIIGGHIGKNSSPEVGKAVFNTLYDFFSQKGIYVAAQCCEHLNRAIVVQRQAVPFAQAVNARPMPKAGGSLAAAAYEILPDCIVVEQIQAEAGIDIGNTLIGMHLKAVAVPLRLEQKKIGFANVVCARTRPKFIGGERALYNQDLL